jgi:hypothetical protein
MLFWSEGAGTPRKQGAGTDLVTAAVGPAVRPRAQGSCPGRPVVAGGALAVREGLGGALLQPLYMAAGVGQAWVQAGQGRGGHRQGSGSGGEEVRAAEDRQ